MRRPANPANPITLAFGATTSPYSSAHPHQGTDFAYSPDDRIYAPFAGVVKQVANNGNDGNGTYMTDPQGRLHGMLHASKYLVPNGSIVKEGDQIAIMGNTGFAEGVHLHWCVKQNNTFIDPMSLLKGEIMPTKAQAYTITDGFYRWGTGQPPTPEQSEYWADRMSTVPTGVQELYDFMRKEAEKNTQYIPYSGKQLFTESNQ